MEGKEKENQCEMEKNASSGVFYYSVHSSTFREYRSKALIKEINRRERPPAKAKRRAGREKNSFFGFLLIVFIRQPFGVSIKISKSKEITAPARRQEGH